MLPVHLGGILSEKEDNTISWDKLCQPKPHGGLGLRKSAHMNKALLTKFSWRLQVE